MAAQYLFEKALHLQLLELLNMTERQNECINEIKELMLAINETVKKHGLEDEFIACLAVGFLDMENTHVD